MRAAGVQISKRFQYEDVCFQSNKALHANSTIGVQDMKLRVWCASIRNVQKC